MSEKLFVLNGVANQSKPLGYIIPMILNYCMKRIYREVGQRHNLVNIVVQRFLDGFSSFVSSLFDKAI